jgi:hypothetical protein
MFIKDKKGRVIEVDDFTLMIIFGIIAFMIVGHC